MNDHLASLLHWSRKNLIPVWLGATLVGLFDVLVAATAEPLQGVGILAPPLVGALMAPPYFAVVAVVEVSWRLRERLNVPSGLDEADPVKLASRRVSAWLVFVALMLATHVLLQKTLSLQDLELVNDLVPVLLALVAVVALAFSGVLTRMLLWPIRRLERRFGLPWPANDGLRFGVFYWLPASFLLWVLVWQHHDVLGPVLWLVFSVVAAATHTSLVKLSDAPWLKRPSKRFAPLAGVYLALFGAAAAEPAFLEPATRLAHATALGDEAAQLFERGTDFDGDGVSALFGGGDCAGFDGAIHPGARDVAENGLDEDCSGSDASTSTETKHRTFHGSLPEKQIERYNVVWIVVDALRSDRVKRRDRPATPGLDRFSEETWFFPNAYSQSSATRISFPSFLSGRWPAQINWRKSSGRYQIGEEQPMIQEELKRLGYRTGVVTNRWFEQHTPSLLRGFDRIDDIWRGDHYTKGRRASAPVSTAHAIDFVASSGETPFFLLVYYEGPHAPYERLHDLGVPDFGKGKRSRYDEEVYFADQHIGLLLNYLRHDRESWKKTIVIVTGDHGEEFKEHGGKHHSRTCYVESVRVPLLVRVPGFDARELSEPVALVDVVPTLFELIGERPKRDLDGRSLAIPALNGDTPSRPIFCSIFSDKKPERSLKRSVRLGEWMLYANRRGSLLELYDTNEDPEEKRNLADDASVQKHRKRLQKRLDESEQIEFRD